MVLICNNNSSVHYGKTMMDIQMEMKLENYDFHSWCDRAPAMWVDIAPPLVVVPLLRLPLQKTIRPDIIFESRIDFLKNLFIVFCLCFYFLLYFFPLFSQCLNTIH